MATTWHDEYIQHCDFQQQQKKISAQFVVWIITLKICWCDDSNYGWYFMCGMLTVWISQTKKWRKRQALITEKLREQDRSSEPFWLYDQHSGPESQRSVGKAEMCVLGGTDTVLSPPASKRMSLLLPQLKHQCLYDEICQPQRETKGKWLMWAI